MSTSKMWLLGLMGLLHHPSVYGISHFLYTAGWIEVPLSWKPEPGNGVIRGEKPLEAARTILENNPDDPEAISMAQRSEEAAAHILEVAKCVAELENLDPATSLIQSRSQLHRRIMG